MSNVFPTNVEICLKKSGWFPNRKMSVSLIKERMIADGYSWFAEAESFLQSFADLSLQFSYDSRTSDALFDAIEASETFDSYWIKDNYSLRIGNFNLCPIGLAYREHLLLFISDKGAVYGGFDSYLALISDNYHDAIENILYRKNFVEIADLKSI